MGCSGGHSHGPKSHQGHGQQGHDHQEQGKKSFSIWGWVIGAIVIVGILYWLS